MLKSVVDLAGVTNKLKSWCTTRSGGVLALFRWQTVQRPSCLWEESGYLEKTLRQAATISAAMEDILSGVKGGVEVIT